MNLDFTSQLNVSTETVFIVFLMFLISCAFSALFLCKRLADAVVVFGAFSFFSAIVFTLLGALDVAFTECCIGAAITTVYFVTGIFVTDDTSHTSVLNPSNQIEKEA